MFKWTIKRDNMEPITLQEAQVSLAAAKRWPKGIGRDDYDTPPSVYFCSKKFRLEHG